MLTWNTSEPQQVVKILLEAAADYARLCGQLGMSNEVDPSLCLTIEPKTGKRYWTERK